MGVQAYAAALIAAHCLELAPDDPRAAARMLRTTTFYGAFELDPATGIQQGHRLCVGALARRTPGAAAGRRGLIDPATPTA